MTLRIAAAAAATMLLVACGGGDSDSESDSGSGSTDTASSAEAASGEEVSTEDFSFTAPEGWEDAAESVPETIPVDVAYAEVPEEGSTFATNVNVVEEPSAFEGNSDEYADANIQALEGAGYASISKEGTFEVADSEFVVVTAQAEQSGTTQLTNQYYTVNDDRAWVVTFSFGEDATENERTELAESVMQTWAWA